MSPPKFDMSFSKGPKPRFRSDEEEHIARLRILVADPNPQLREIIRDILLRGIGVQEVLECKDGDEALHMLRDLGADVVLADSSMPHIGGIELTQKIRTGVEGVDPFLPVIVMSNHAEIGEIVAARDAGTTEYLAKPLSAKILDLRLHAVVEHPRPFVRSDDFFGPDRRRHDKQGFQGQERRVEQSNLIPPQV